MTFSVDVMGFENDISEAIKACRKFVSKNKDVKIILVGDKQKILPYLKNEEEFEIEDASDVILMTDEPISVRNKKDSSMYKAIELVKDDKAHAVLSAGNTACYVFLTHLLLKKLNKISKAGFMPFVPTRNNVGLNILDVGANKEVAPIDLVNFAIMGNVYVKETRNIEKPKIGLINIGTEDNKGLDYLIKANKILKENKQLNYVGFIEPRNLIEGEVDIAVADGFIGNIVLKTLEGTSKTISRSLKDQYKKPWNWLGLLFSIFALKKIKKKFDYKNNAGAFVIGLTRIAFKTHGNADFKQFYSSLRMMKETIDNSVLKKIEREFN